MIDLDSYEERAVLIAGEIYVDQIKTWNAAIRQQMKKYSDHLSLPPVSPSFQKLTEKAMMLAYLTGREKAFDTIRKTKALAKGREYADLENWDLTTYDEAVRMLRDKGVISPDEFKEASAAIKAASFSVQRIERLNALFAIKDSILLAVQHGLVFEDWAALLDEVWKTHGVTPLAPHHLKTIYRTNMGSAYEIASDEATRGDPWVWGYEYSGILDGRESDICRPFFGVKRKKDDPFWATARPLNHYNCRCTLITLTQYDVEELGVKETEAPSTETVHPDFQDNPRSLPEYNRKMNQYAQQKERDISDIDNKILNFSTQNDGKRGEMPQESMV